MGLIRIILSLSVIAGHANTTVFGIDGVDMAYAVQAFFIISGFYMSLVLNDRYRDLPLSSFYKSRALRIYPSYYVGLIATLFVSMTTIKATLANLVPLARDWLITQNVIIFGQDTSYIVCLKTRDRICAEPIDVTINPPAWSLSVELGFYLLAPFIVRDPRRIVAFIGTGTLYLLLTNGFKLPILPVSVFRYVNDYPLRYYFYPSSFVFFGLGALAFHLRNLPRGKTYPLVIAGVFASAFVETAMPPWHAIVFAAAVPKMFEITKNNAWDRSIGELSFPLYILHWPILVYCETTLPKDAWIFHFMTLGSIVAVVATLAGIVLYFAVDRPIGRIRHPPTGAGSDKPRETRLQWLLCLTYVTMPFAALMLLEIVKPS